MGMFVDSASLRDNMPFIVRLRFHFFLRLLKALYSR